LLAVVSGLAQTGSVAAARTGLILAKAITFLVVAIGLGIRYSPVPRLGRPDEGSRQPDRLRDLLLRAAGGGGGAERPRGDHRRLRGRADPRQDRAPRHIEEQIKPVADLFVPIFFVRS